MAAIAGERDRSFVDDRSGRFGLPVNEIEVGEACGDAGFNIKRPAAISAAEWRQHATGLDTKFVNVASKNERKRSLSFETVCSPTLYVSTTDCLPEAFPAQSFTNRVAQLKVFGNTDYYTRWAQQWLQDN